MKFKLLASVLLFSGVVSGAFAQGRANVSGEAAVIVESENKVLARAYVQAFGALVRPPFTLTMQRESVTYVLEDVRGLKDAGGLLVVEVGRGYNYIVNPKDVVAISDGPAVQGHR